MPSLSIEVTDTISIVDDALALPPADTSVTENITLSDEVEVRTLPLPVDLIDIILPTGPLEPGAIFTAIGNGFKPFTSVQAFLQSEPVLVGEEIADAVGIVTFIITIPADFPPGDHSLILLGQGFDGFERQLTAPVKVDRPDMIFGNGFE